MSINLKSSLLSLIKIIFISGLMLSVYYFLILRPKIEKQKLINEVSLVLNIHKDILVQNKLSFVGLAKLDSSSANFDIERGDLITSLKESSDRGLEELNKSSQIPGINLKLGERFSQLIAETRQIYEEQNKLLERVFVTKTFNEGIKILKSNEAVELLTRQTNLILEYEFWLRKL